MLLWLRRADDSPNRKILWAAIVIGLLSLVGKAGATVKELIVAGRFGRSDALDAFLIAYLLPSFATVLIRAAFESAVIPALVEEKQNQRPEAAQRLFSSMLFLNALALLALTGLLGVLSPFYLPYLGSGFSPEKLRLTSYLLYTLLPFVFFNGMAGTASAALNAGEAFALPALAPILTPLATILFVLLGPVAWGPYLLVAGVVTGSLMETVVLARALRGHGMRFRLRWGGLNPQVSLVLAQFGPMLAGAFLMSSTGIVDQSMAASLSAGSVAALSYANKIVAVAISSGASALSIAALPYLSKMVAGNDWAGCRHTLKRYTLLVVATTVPFTLGLIAFSKPLVRLFFQRGAFSSADTDLVSRVQICYAFQIPFYVLNGLFVRFLSSVRRNDAVLYVAAINLIMDIVLNLILMRRWGVAGLALSTSFVYFFSFLLVAAWSVRFLARQHSPAVEEQTAVPRKNEMARSVSAPGHFSE